MGRYYHNKKLPVTRKKILPAMVCKDFNSNFLFVQTIERPLYIRTNYRKMPETEVELPQKNYTAPKRYETTCYFMPLAVPVWYSTSVSIKINSTKRNYKETVNYQNKLVPYRFVETMTTDICGKQPAIYVSEEIIEKKLPSDEHYISLEPQQKSEITLDKPFMSNHHIAIENHT